MLNKFQALIYQRELIDKALALSFDYKHCPLKPILFGFISVHRSKLSLLQLKWGMWRMRGSLSKYPKKCDRYDETCSICVSSNKFDGCGSKFCLGSCCAYSSAYDCVLYPSRNFECVNGLCKCPNATRFSPRYPIWLSVQRM